MDTKLRVRPRSALGLKYVEVIPGKSKTELKPGSTVSLKNASEPLEIEDVLSTFDRDTRPSARVATEGFGDAFAGRGPALNATIEQLNPFFVYLTPVMTNLASPDTDLPSFFRELGRTSAQVAPVAEVQAQLFTNMADTFAAIGFSPRALQDTIAKGPDTLDVGTRSLRAQRPFLDDFAELSVALRPAVQELPRSLPALNQSFRVGTKVLPQTVPLNERLQSAFVSLDRLFANPNTLLGLRDIRSGLAVTRPLVEFLNPYQSVCNYPVYFLHALGEHMSAKASATLPRRHRAGPGRQALQRRPAQRLRPERRGPAGGHPARPEGAGRAPRSRRDPGGRACRAPVRHALPARDRRAGQRRLPGGPDGLPERPALPAGDPLRPGPRSGRAEPTGTGGNGAVATDDYPVLTGGTYKSRQLGIDNLKDVP